MMGNGLQRDGVRKELPRIALTRFAVALSCLSLYFCCLLLLLEVTMLIQVAFVQNPTELVLFGQGFTSIGCCAFSSVYVSFFVRL